MTKDQFVTEVRAEQARLRAFVRGLGTRRDAVDDISQEAFVIAWQKRDQFQPGSNFGAWVREIARGLVMNEIRKNARRRRILDDGLTEQLLEAAITYDNAARVLSRREHADCLRDCLQTVPDKGRELLQLRYFENMGPTTMASHLGINANQIRQSLMRLRRSLLGCIEARLAGRTI